MIFAVKGNGRMRLINADALQAEYKKQHDGKRLLLIDVAPTVDAVPVVHGRWIRQDDRRKTLYGWYFCSECGAFIGGKTNFCSECGADMREDGDV